jgi:ATPase family protein associated with various cellular activities (AAA)
MQHISFADRATTPAEHFKLYFYATVLHLSVQVGQSFGSYQAMFEQFPFLTGYYDELTVYGVDETSVSEEQWRAALYTWEQDAACHLPLRALRETTGLSHTELLLLLCVGLVEEDVRFGLLFEAMHGISGQHRPTLGVLNAWWKETSEYGDIRRTLKRLLELGLLQAVNADAPRIEWALHVPSVLWDVMRGELHETLAPYLRYHLPEQCIPLDTLILPDALKQQLGIIPQLLASKAIRTLVIRGPLHNGRRTLMSTIACQLKRGLLEGTEIGKGDDERWRLLGPLATLLHALPVIVLDLMPGETAILPPLAGYDGPLGIVLGKQGGIGGPCTEHALALTLDIPDIVARRLHWQQSFGDHPVTELDAISERLRITGGNIQRTASIARSYAKLAQRETVTLADVRQASRALNRQVLETLATPIPSSGDWSQLAVSGETLRELMSLEQRCRHREQLHTLVGPALDTQLHSGVRALLSGPSGTGKTLAAKLLAAVLQMDLYRLDLSAIVNKYIGETEKNLNQLFARAEELDVILLLDEGDALLTRRTQVQSSNDRYANLETNYLLQRLETFEGILVVTTNASDRIDSAFQRRMDIVVEFRPPEPSERWLIWQLHLPVMHQVEHTLLREITSRCILTGGQIRNAVLHASLLALQDGGVMNSAHVEAAIQREYRKLGAVCPLRSGHTASMNGR